MADGCPYTLNGPEDGMAKRANGEGSIFRRKDGTWSAELSYWDDYGALKRRTVYGKTQAEARAKFRDARERIESGHRSRTPP